MSSEVPDAIGWTQSGRLSYLVECKASRGDFLADKKKPHRQPDGKGMGCYRYFMCPPGLIKADELPTRWGLLYCYPTRVSIIAGHNPRKWDSTMSGYYWHASRELEMAMLYSALNRLRIDLGDPRFRERIHIPYRERQRLAERPRRNVFF